jgi:hypothetical protein
VVDLQRMHYGGVRDPIKSLVECGTGQDVETVVVDGETLLENGHPTRVDEAKLLAEVQAAAQEWWESLPTWRPKGQTIDEVAPMSFPTRPR